jgi:hypothetical protein
LNQSRGSRLPRRFRALRVTATATATDMNAAGRTWTDCVHSRGGLARKPVNGERTWCRSGATDPVERQAEIFSAALLILEDRLLAVVPRDSWRGWPTICRLADACLVNVTPMAIRLEKLGKMHRDETGAPASGPAPSRGQGMLFE